jgi:hypothetical protein
VADSYYAVRVATFAYDRLITDEELTQIRNGQLTAPAQAALATGAVVRDAGGGGNSELRAVYVLAGDQFESVAEPGVLYETPTDSTHVVFVEEIYLQPTTQPVTQGTQAPALPPGSSGAVPVSTDPFGLGSLVDPTLAAATPKIDWIPAIIVGVIVGVIVNKF